MINGAHIIIYSKDAEADITFIKNVLKFKYVDVQKGWLIFKLPPSEVAVHPSDENDMHEFYLMTDDLDSEMAALKKAGRMRRSFATSLGTTYPHQIARGRNARALSAASRATLVAGRSLASTFLARAPARRNQGFFD